MRRPVVAALAEEERPGQYVRSGRRVVNPKAVYGGQRGDAQSAVQADKRVARAANKTDDVGPRDRSRAAVDVAGRPVSAANSER